MNDVNKTLNDFLSDEEVEEEVKKTTIKTDNTIIERIDKIIITETGKQLLREQY